MQQKEKYILDFILHLMEDYKVPVNRLQAPFSDIEPLDFGLRSDILNQTNSARVIDDFFQNLKENNIYFLYDIFECSYIIFYHPTTKCLFCIGPFLSEQMTKKRLDRIFEKLGLPEVLRFPIAEYYQQIACIPAPDFVEKIFIQLGRDLYGDDCESVYLDFQKRGYHYLDFETLLPAREFSQTDLLAKRYEVESNFLAAVSMGNETKAYELAKSLFEMPYIDEPPVGWELRYHKNYLISISAVLRKLMEYNGIHPIHFHDLYKNSFKYIERCASHSQLTELMKNIIYDYCKVSKSVKRCNCSPVIESILTYIDTDLRADLTLKAFSKYLNLTPSYLSDLFSKEMGISLTNYVTQKRMALAQLQLGMTTLSVKKIAENCGYSDIQYFNRTFKKHTGVTPKAYHNTYYLSKENMTYQFAKRQE